MGAMRSYAKSIALSAARLAQSGQSLEASADETKTDQVGAWLGFAVGIAVAAAAFSAV